jgi:hypothetical protein
MQDDEPENDAENAKKVHNCLNNIKDDSKPDTAASGASRPAPTGPSMTA